MSDIEKLVKDAIDKYETDHPWQSYYTVVPSNVLFDDNLSDAEFKLLCILLSFLTIKGEAYPSNKYLSDKFNKSPQNVSKYISSLIKKGYLIIEFEMNGKEIKKRIIKPTEVLLKSIRGIINSDNRGIINSNKDNNIKINNINEIKEDKYFQSIFKSMQFDNLEITEWVNWCEYRKEKKHKITERTAKSQLKLLKSLSNPAEVIEQSIRNGWLGLFPVKQNYKTNTGMVVEKGRPQYTADEWNKLITVTCQTKEERKEIYNKYNFDKATNLWIKK